ncbi:MAG: prolipoprotein diacylglyceryl transferase [Flavobacteriaceae bacterium]
MYFLKVNWAPSKTLFEIGGFGLHIYSLMFVIAFALGYRMMQNMFKKEGVDEKYLDPYLAYMVLSTLIGARLGEVFFYSWDYYQQHLLEIFLPIRQTADGGYSFVGFRGLASHGAVIGILTGMYLFQRKYHFKPLLWILDRLGVVVALAGFFIRVGNFFNSEIVGKYTGTNFGVVFQNRGEVLPRHPAQLYEAIGYLILFFIMRNLYNSPKKDKSGFLLGLFFAGIFGIRFMVEFVKASQGGFEKFLPGLSTGQWLSIPLVGFGLYLMFKPAKNVS